MKILELNEYRYSREEFEGYTNRAVFRISISEDFREDTVVNIYTDNPDKEDVKKVIEGRKAEKVTSCKMEHWTTKEQDDLTSKFIDETLKDI